MASSSQAQVCVDFQQLSQADIHHLSALGAWLTIVASRTGRVMYEHHNLFEKLVLQEVDMVDEQRVKQVRMAVTRKIKDLGRAGKVCHDMNIWLDMFPAG